MPLYEYKCSNEKCQKIFSEILPMKDCDKRMKCPDCGADAKKQLGCHIDTFAASKWRM